MEKLIIFTDEFHHSIQNLVEILFEDEYFGIYSDCELYTDKIYDFVAENIEFPISKNSPTSHQKFGEKFIKYTANKRTTWYIFFDQKDNKFLVNHITNNHSHNFPELL